MSEPATNNGPKLPVMGLVLSVVGLCFPPLLLVSFGIGVYSFLRSRKEAEWAPRKQISQMTMAVSGAGVVVFLGLGLPAFKSFPLRAKQQVCKQLLTDLYIQEVDFKKDHQRYTTRIADLPKPPLQSAQLIRLAGEGPLIGADAVGIPSNEGPIDEKLSTLLRPQIGLQGECPTCQLTIACAAQLDTDEVLDVWTVATVERTGSSGERIPAGMPWLDSDDVRQ